jgi:hypothetical protein
VEEINKRSFGEISITGGRVTAEGNIGYGINFPGSAGNSGGSVTIGDNAEVSFSGDILAETIIWNRTLSFDLGSGSSVTVTANEEGKAVENSQAE